MQYNIEHIEAVIFMIAFLQKWKVNKESGALYHLYFAICLNFRDI